MRRAFHGMCHPKTHHHHHLLHLQAHFMQHTTQHSFATDTHHSILLWCQNLVCSGSREKQKQVGPAAVFSFLKFAPCGPTCLTCPTCSHLLPLAPLGPRWSHLLHLVPYGPTCPSCPTCPKIVFMHRLPRRRDLGSHRGQCDRGGFACFSSQRERDQVRQVGLLREVEQVAKAPSSGTSGTRGYFKKQTPQHARARNISSSTHLVKRSIAVRSRQNRHR